MNTEPSQHSHHASANDHAADPVAGQGPALGGAYEPLPQPAPEGPNKLIIAIAATGLAIAVFGLAREMFFRPAESQAAAPVARQPSPWETQQQLMRDAIDTARAAQDLQRQHQENMRRAMEASEYGGYPEEDW